MITRAMVLFVAVLSLPGPAGTAEFSSRTPVARLGYSKPGVEIRRPGEDWQPVQQGGPVRTGDELRTPPGTALRIDFPWMSLSAGPGSEWVLAGGRVLSTSLRRGRVEVFSEGVDWVKIITPEAQIRGRGHAVVRRDEGVTRVMVLSGRVTVRTGRAKRTLAARQGAKVTRDGRVVPTPLPQPPQILAPGNDPVYVTPGREVELRWRSSGQRHLVRLVPLDTPHPVALWETDASPLKVRLTAPGTYRWQVAAFDGEGLESTPSAEGWVCVLEF